MFAFLFSYGANINMMIPFNIPRWMMPDSLFFYVGTFLMPTLVHALFIIVVQFVDTSNSDTNKQSKVWKDFVSAFAIPLSWYLFAILIELSVPLFHYGFTFRLSCGGGGRFWGLSYREIHLDVTPKICCYFISCGKHVLMGNADIIVRYINNIVLRIIYNTYDFVDVVAC